MLNIANFSWLDRKIYTEYWFKVWTIYIILDQYKGVEQYTLVVISLLLNYMLSLTWNIVDIQLLIITQYALKHVHDWIHQKLDVKYNFFFLNSLTDMLAKVGKLNYTHECMMNQFNFQCHFLWRYEMKMLITGVKQQHVCDLRKRGEGGWAWGGDISNAVVLPLNCHWLSPAQILSNIKNISCLLVCSQLTVSLLEVTWLECGGDAK